MEKPTFLNKLTTFITENFSVEEKIQLKAHAKEIEVQLNEVTPATPAVTTPALEAPAVPTSGSEIPLADGTTLKVAGELVTGVEATVVTPDGEIPAPEGELKAMDGKVIKITKQGEKSIVAEIIEAVEDDAALKAKEAELAAEASAKERVTTTKIIEKFEAQLAAQTAEMAKQKETIDNLALKLSKQAVATQKAFEFVTALSNIPTEEPIKKEVIISKKEKALSFLLDRKV